ncbi:hypothetical protein AB0F49_04170 [Micromonospora ureilytica]|uniref:hypothetical protein n=1 Tax=Micromonospora ureilytica TaxID=709868 RepID=UPI0033D527EA
MLDERQMSDLMLAEIESAETPSRVLDVDRAMSTVRRQRRLARGTGATLLAAALTVGALTVPDLLNPDRPPAATMPSNDGEKAVATGLPAALTTIDPTRVYVRFGWLPDGIRNLQYQAGRPLPDPGAGPAAAALAARHIGRVYLGATSSRSGDQWHGVALTLSPKGAPPPVPQRNSGQAAIVIGASAGPELNGGASTFTAYTGAEAPETVLAWRYAPDGWAQLRVFGTGTDTKDTAVRVARSLRFGDDPVQLPGKVADLPADLRLTAVDVTESLEQPGYWYASTQWSPEASAGPGSAPARVLRVGISRYRHVTDPSDKAYVNPNTTIDGHPARFGGENGNESLTVYDVNGATVTIDDDALLPAGGTKALFRMVTLVPEPATWHTHLHR